MGRERLQRVFCVIAYVSAFEQIPALGVRDPGGLPPLAKQLCVIEVVVGVLALVEGFVGLRVESHLVGHGILQRVRGVCFDMNLVMSLQLKISRRHVRRHLKFARGFLVVVWGALVVKWVILSMLELRFRSRFMKTLDLV